MAEPHGAILPLSYQDGSADRDDLINQSLAWSRIQSERLLQWSTSNNRGRLVAMRFHQEWRHDQCPMTRWYNEQSASSTLFRSIEHRKNIQGPFFHEFLVLNLADDAVCRVERIGDGSRADAIRSVGCRSYDLIQWFSRNNSSAATNDSEIITRVDLARDFDILDVLAVCYSIQRIKACSVYTLQRYNCYFLCLTVLTVLARRVASWETIVTADTWDSRLTSVLDGLSNLSPEESDKHLILKICRLLEPDNVQPATFIIDGLRAHLASGTSALADYRKALCGMLWQTSRDSVFHDSLFNVLESSSIDSLFAGEGFCATQLRHAIQMDRGDAMMAIVSNQLLGKHYVKVYAGNESRLLIRTAEVYSGIRRPVNRLETLATVPMIRFSAFGKIFTFRPTTFLKLSLTLQPISFRTIFPLDRLGFVQLIGFYTVLGGVFFSVLVSWERGLVGPSARSKISGMSVRALFVVHVAWYLCRLVMLADFRPSNERKERFNDAERSVRRLEVVPSITAILDTLGDEGVLGPSETSLVVGHSVGGWQAAEILCSFVTPNLCHDLHTILESQPNHIRLHPEPEDEPSQGDELTTVAEFQESYVRQRIDAHAKRVDAHQLAAAPLVCQDIENTMTEIWRSLPPGFGSVVEDGA